MNRVQPLRLEDLSEDSQEVFKPIVERMGFIPSSQLVMARKPKLLRAWINLARAVYDPEASISLQLRNMLALASSSVAQSSYCMAHASSNSARSGVPEEKISAILEFESSDLFTEAEKAALRFAKHAAAVPNKVTDQDMAELRKHYSDDEIVEMMAVVAAFGFLNRWNDSMATGLEEGALEFGERVLAPMGWDAGEHAVAEAGD